MEENMVDLRTLLKAMTDPPVGVMHQSLTQHDTALITVLCDIAESLRKIADNTTKEY